MAFSKISKVRLNIIASQKKWLYSFKIAVILVISSYADYT